VSGYPALPVPAGASFRYVPVVPVASIRRPSPCQEKRAARMEPDKVPDLADIGSGVSSGIISTSGRALELEHRMHRRKMTDRDDISTAFPLSTRGIPAGTVDAGHYRVSFARTAEELDAIQRLRFEVFNLELGEGLEASFETGRDVDRFDAVCHHLQVTDLESGDVVGCYRMQTATMAAKQAGFYSAGLFDLSSLPEGVVRSAMEVGRACVAREHRSKHVLFLLWKGLAMYVAHNRLRYLFGCCSLTSQDHAEGWAVVRFLEEHGHLHPELRVAPLSECALEQVEPDASAVATVTLPILFRTYLRYGSKVCGDPAIDREFKTIDYLVVLDVETLSPRTRQVFFG
jgi:putative hemolysin